MQESITVCGILWEAFWEDVSSAKHWRMPTSRGMEISVFLASKKKENNAWKFRCVQVKTNWSTIQMKILIA